MIRLFFELHVHVTETKGLSWSSARSSVADITSCGKPYLAERQGDIGPHVTLLKLEDRDIERGNNVARGAMCTPALPRIAIAERRETWIVWVCTKCCWGIIHAYHQRAQLICLKFTTSA